MTVQGPTIPDSATVVSEYGDVMTVGNVKALDGVRRRDGLSAGTTLINAHFISTGGDLNAVTGSSGVVILETYTLS